jgi:hypothetical protein
MYRLVAALMVLSLAVAACSPSGENRMIEKGIGADLHTKDLYQETELLEQYSAFICVQANLPTIPESGTVPANVVRCDYSRMTKALWTNFLVQGMNDIDRRCDAYLQWLDAKRRDKDALQKQIHDTDLTTRAILGFAEVSTNAISIVGAAFGLLSNSVENYHSRLLLEIDGSTVSTIVLTNRNKFRDDRNVYKAASKPEVIYVLRSYLRLCLPFAIEREINAFAEHGVQGITGADARSPLDPAEVVTAPASAVPATPDSPVGPQPLGSKFILGAISDYEKKIEVGDGKRIQLALCVSDDGNFGTMNSATREAIRQFNQVRIRNRLLDAAVANDETKLKTINSAGEFTAIIAGSPLPCTAHKNAFERFLLPEQQNIREFQASLKSVVLPNGGVSPEIATQVQVNGQLDENTRKAIGALQLRQGFKVTGELNNEFYAKIVELRS